MSLVAALSLVTACVDSSEEEAQTPADAPTVSNSALQTDSAGETVTAPAATAPAEGGDEGGSTAPASGGGAPAGDVAAGEAVFAASCTGCHLNNGMDDGGVGPKLVGIGDDEEKIRDQVVNGGGAMPAGLASGKDLDNVVAYVVSLQ